MISCYFTSYHTDIYASLTGHVIERGYAGTAVCLTETFLPLAFTILPAIFRAVSTKHVVEVVAVTS